LDESEPKFQGHGASAAPRDRGRDSQPLIDESDDLEDDSLDLSQDDAAPLDAAPQATANPIDKRVETSPYTGLTITPNETEQSVAREPDENTPLMSNPPAAAPAPAARGLAAPNAAAAAAPPPAAPAAPINEEPLPTLDEDQEDADDESLTIPDDEPAEADRKPAGDSERRETQSESDDEGPRLLKGFRRYCPVLLKDERKLVEANPQFASNYRGATFQFSSAAAKSAFEENPRKYVPAGGGSDVVRLAAGEKGVEGSLEYAAWYRGRLYLFSSAESRKTFVETPSRYVVTD
jgi:YHS domain-containing protein